MTPADCRRRRFRLFTAAPLMGLALTSCAVGSHSGAVGPPPARPAAQPAPVDDQEPPTSTPPGVEWRSLYGAWVPSGPAGPTVTDGPVVRGYARTPVGALIAAEQIGARLVASRNGGRRRVATEQTVPDGGQANWLTMTAGLTDNPLGYVYAQSAGFRFVTYSPNATIMQLVYRHSDGRLVLGTVTMRWVDGDWRMQLPAANAAAPVQQVVASLDGFVAFGKGA